MESRWIFLNKVIKELTLKYFLASINSKSVIKCILKKTTRCMDYKRMFFLLSTKRKRVVCEWPTCFRIEEPLLFCWNHSKEGIRFFVCFCFLKQLAAWQAGNMFWENRGTASKIFFVPYFFSTDPQSLKGRIAGKNCSAHDKCGWSDQNLWQLLLWRVRRA